MTKVGIFRVRSCKIRGGYPLDASMKVRYFLTLRSAIRYVERISESRISTDGIETAVYAQVTYNQKTIFDYDIADIVQRYKLL